MSGEWTPQDKIYISFMGPPLMPALVTCGCRRRHGFTPEKLKSYPLEAKCECGNVIKFAHDEDGFYFQGVTMITVGEKILDGHREEIVE